MASRNIEPRNDTSDKMVSIVIPVYNREKSEDFLRLLISLAAITYSSYEILLCDDGSTDKTLEICHKATMQNPNIRVLACEHHGVSAARNEGIGASRGKWICFVDSDDRVTPNFLTALTDPINQGIDLVFCSYYVVSKLGIVEKIYENETFNKGPEMDWALSNTDLLHRCGPWAKLFRKSVLVENNIRFDTMLHHSEDRVFIYQFLLNCRGIATTSTVGYIYSSLSAGSLKFKRHNLAMLFYRQEIMEKLADEAAGRFNIHGKGLQHMADNLGHLALGTLVEIGIQCGNNSATRRLQTEFFDKHISQSPIIRNAVGEGLDLEIQTKENFAYAASGNFKRLNRRNLILEKKILASRLLLLVLRGGRKPKQLYIEDFIK